MRPLQSNFNTTINPLRVLLLGVTGHCNLRCKMCSIWQDTNDFLSPSHLRTLLDDVFVSSNVEYLGLTGGEPFLHNKLELVVTDCVSKLERLKEISITTNGSIPNRILESGGKIVSLCRDSAFNLIFNLSIDGIETTHDLQRGVSGSFKKLLTSLNILRDLTCDVSNASIQLSTVLTRWNVEDFTDLLRFAKTEQLRISVSLPLETNGYYKTDRLNDDFFITASQKQKLLTQIKRLLITGQAARTLDDLSESHLAHLIDHLDGKQRVAPCVFRNRSGCLVTSQGEVFACGGGEDFRLGHLDNESLSSILKRPDSKNNSLQSSICDSCPSICYLHAGE